LQNFNFFFFLKTSKRVQFPLFGMTSCTVVLARSCHWLCTTPEGFSYSVFAQFNAWLCIITCKAL
jgi:hypothetical protein